MPPAVLSDRPPESNTTPLPTSASVALRARRLVREPQEPRRPLGTHARRRSRRRAAPARAARRASTLTVRPLARASARASFTTVSGDFASAGSFTRSRAHATAFRDARAARQPVAHLGVARPSTCTRVELRRLRVRLVREELVARRARHLRRTPARRRRGRSSRARRRAPWSRPSRPSTRGARPRRRPGAARRRRACRARPCPTSTAALAPSCPPVGTASASPRLASKPASAMNASERAAERLVDHVGARAERPAR